MILIDDELLLIENSKKYLTAFLEDSGSFFPFAMIMDNNDIIYPLEHRVEEEYPNPNSLIELYEQTFCNEIKEKQSEYKLGILCIDIFIHETIDGVDSKRNAIEIRLIGSTYQKKVVLFYDMTDAYEIVFQELIGWN
jgi:hypothetical protein